MTKTRINHTDCSHAATPAGRAACRASGDWYLLSVNNGHDRDCLDNATDRAWANDESLTGWKAAARVGLSYLDNGVTSCICGKIPPLDY